MERTPFRFRWPPPAAFPIPVHSCVMYPIFVTNWSFANVRELLLMAHADLLGWQGVSLVD